MRRMLLAAAALAVLVSGCATDEFQQTKAQVAQSIAAEQPGGYYIGRRFYRRDFFFFGFLLGPQPPPQKAPIGLVGGDNDFCRQRPGKTRPVRYKNEKCLRGVFFCP